MRLFGGGGVLTRVIAELKAIKKFGSLEVWKFGGITRRLSWGFTDFASNYKLINLSTEWKFGSLAAWKFRGITRRLSQYFFACLDFINPFNLSTIKPFNRKRSAFAPAFTMAEILISLTIIGIIAAITLPALQANINEKTWAAQRKALYSRISQALALMPSLNGYGIGATEQETADKAAQAFISDGLSKVLKISNICDGSTAEGLKKCGFPNIIRKGGDNAPKMDTPKTLVELSSYFGINNAAVSYSQINTNAAAFETVNGESILAFYYPNCSYTYGVNRKNNEQNLIQPTMCANFVFDLNGSKGPNQVGKDIGFITAFYPSDSEIVMPVPVNELVIIKNDSRPTFTLTLGNASCRKKYGDDAKMANIEELKSIFVNNYLGFRSGKPMAASDYPRFLVSDSYFSSTLYGNEGVYVFNGSGGSVSYKTVEYQLNSSNAYTARVFCLRK